MMRVQSLVEAGIAEVPPQYIQSLDNQPTNKYDSVSNKNCKDNDDIPLIDLFGFDAEHRDLVREAVGEACREWGAFHVTNHGVPLQLLDEMRSVGLSFFNHSSLQDKLKYACDPTSSASQGYGSKMLLAAGSSSSNANPVLDWRDYFDHHTLPLSRRDPSCWPHFPPNYRYINPTQFNPVLTKLGLLLSLWVWVCAGKWWRSIVMR